MTSPLSNENSNAQPYLGPKLAMQTTETPNTTFFNTPSEASKPQFMHSLELSSGSQPDRSWGDVFGIMQEMAGNMLQISGSGAPPAQRYQGNTPSGSSTSPIGVRMIEVGTNGVEDKHSKQVKEIFANTSGHNAGSINVDVVGTYQPKGNKPMPEKFETLEDLDQMIDSQSTYVLNTMTEKIDESMAAGDRVVNGSLGWSRASSYMEVIKMVAEHPTLGKQLGLSSSDISRIQVDQAGSVVPTSIPASVKNAVVEHVDQRLAQPGSDFQSAMTRYQDKTKSAAQSGLNIVLASANDGQYRGIFQNGQAGLDSNFLMDSDYVFSAAAANTMGTADTSDDKIASFSSFGNGHFNPTVAANGVNIQTSEGNATGTSFASPIVAGTITKMLEGNPNLSFDEIKQKLQSTATGTSAPDQAEGAGMLNSDAAIRAATQDYVAV